MKARLCFCLALLLQIGLVSAQEPELTPTVTSESTPNPETTTPTPEESTTPTPVAPLWGHVHDRAERFKEKGQPGALVEPVTSGAFSYYAIGSSLYRVDAADGKIQQRILMPGYATKIEPQGAGVAVTVRSFTPEMEWIRQYKVQPSRSEVPFFLSGALMAANLTRTDASKAPPEQLQALAESDPTNPWYFFELGRHQFENGQKTEAEASFKAALALDPAYDYELLAMALKLDPMTPELGDAAFERGMRFLETHGYEPKLMLSLIGVMIHYGSAMQGKERNQATVLEYPRLQKLARRMERLAPMVEGAAYFFQGVSEAASKAGATEEAKHWAELAKNALPGRFFGMTGNAGERTGLGLNLFMSGVMALITYLSIKLIRNFREPWRWPFVRWTPWEILGFLLVYPALLWGGLTAMHGVRIIGKAAAMPLASTMGSFGHPDAVEYWSKLQSNPAADFLKALSMHQAGMKKEAGNLYAQSPLEEAKTNLRILESGKKGTLDLPGPDLWEQAFGDGPSEGLFSILQLFGQLANAGSGQIALLGLNETILAILGTFGFFALLGLLLSKEEPEDNLINRMLELVVPGTAQFFGVFGAPILTVTFFSMMVHYALIESHGMATNILEAIAVPNMQQALGAAAQILSSLDSAIRESAQLWLPILCLNTLMVLAYNFLRYLRERSKKKRLWQRISHA